MKVKELGFGCLRATLLATTLLTATPALAQVTTGTIRGDVQGAGAGETVTARNDETGLTRAVRTAADGTYSLVGLPPGTYTITSDNTEEIVRLQVGQSLIVDLGSDTSDEIVVTGVRTRNEVITSEVATNITTEQIDLLPQSSRNFLNFAQLAPGVRVSRDEFRQSFSGGASNAEGSSLSAGQTNVFIDGVSLKSNVNQGGLVGQDSSRGNPFSQLAVQEFRVLSQNFKAEFEQAGSSIITAVTKSGTNEFHGDVFGLFAGRALRENDAISEDRGNPKPEFQRYQFGADLSGPIIKDKLFFFVSYEGNYQDREFTVTPGGLEDLLPFDVTPFLGSRTSPFREHLGFAKLNWNISDRQTAEATFSIRNESDIRGFGNGPESLERAENIENDVITARFKHQYAGDAFLNEFSFDYLTSSFEPSPLNPDVPGRVYIGAINLGGRPTIQDVEEENFTFRNNVTFSNLSWHGNHIVKAGLRASFQNYDVLFDQFGNPEFVFVNDPSRGLDFTFPEVARFGLGDPAVSANNKQFGVFVQDDWDVTDKLQLNIGVRWDVETNSNNKDFVTPSDAVAALNELEAVLSTQPGNFFKASDYISTGNNRSPFFKAIQPRLGFSYDVFGDKATVVFGGWGRSFDRTLFRNAAEESIFRQFAIREFQFSLDGAPRNGRPTIVWDPSFLSREGLEGLIATNVAPNGELRVFKNDQKPPRSDQFSFGIRQRIWEFQTSFTYSHIIGKNDISYFPANRSVEPNVDGFFDFIPVTGFGNVVASNDERETRFNSLFITLDRPYTEHSHWGLNIAYTLAFAKEKGFLFNFDFPNVEEAQFHPNAANERHRIVVSGIVDLPLGLKLSTLSTFASGQPFFVVDASQGFGGDVINLGNFGDQPGVFGFKQVDLRLQKDIKVGKDDTVSLFAEALNIFDTENIGGRDGFIPPLPGVNPNFGNRNGLAGPPRTIQFGAKISF